MATEGNVHVEGNSDVQSVIGVDTDADGQFDIPFTGVRNVNDIGSVSAHAAGGYVVNPVSVSGNTVTFELLQSGGADSKLSAVANGADVTDVHAMVN